MICLLVANECEYQNEHNTSICKLPANLGFPAKQNRLLKKNHMFYISMICLLVANVCEYQYE